MQPQPNAASGAHQQRFILITAHAFIGLGLLFLHVYHLNSVFEQTTNFSKLNRLQRQMLFRNEDSLYYYVYQTIAEAKDFRSGFEEILKNNFTQYPNTINLVEYFSILPEIVIAYLYKQFIQLTTYYNIPTVSCWQYSAPSASTTGTVSDALDDSFVNNEHDDDIIFRHHLDYYYDRQNSVICEGPGISMFFYLEVIWYLGGLTVFTLYMFAAFLSRHVLGGICAVVFYFSIHSDATRIHLSPSSRDSIAIPLILAQMYFLSAWMEQHNFRYANDQTQSNQENSEDSSSNARPDDTDVDDINLIQTDYNEMKLAILTLFALVAWDFSSYIFFTQTIIIFIMCNSALIKRRYTFLLHYTSAHAMAHALAHLLKHDLLEFQLKSMSFHFALLMAILVYTIQKHPLKRRQRSTLEKIIIKVVFLCMIAIMIVETFVDKNLYYHYTDILLTKLRLKMPKFSTLLHMRKPEYGFMDDGTLKRYFLLFSTKFLVVFIITWTADWLHKRRQIKENEAERIERIKTYVLEDYLEENKLSMMALANIEQNKEIKKCMDLLKAAGYDYEKYKLERRSQKQAKLSEAGERTHFLNEVKRFKDEISEKESQKSSDIQVSMKKSDEDTKAEEETQVADGSNAMTAASDANSDDRAKKSTTSPRKPLNFRKSFDWNQLLAIERPQYVYAVFQTTIIFIMAVLIYKIKYVLTPFLCLIAASFPFRQWTPKSYSLWTIYLIIIGNCVFDPGLQSIKKEYSIKYRNYSEHKVYEENMYDMLRWISANTDSSAAFAGPESIIGTVLLATGRPIVNHPLNEHPEMRKRTRIVHSILSKQDSAEVYNQLSSLRVDYIILSNQECFAEISNNIPRISQIWDMAQPEFQNNIQLCADLFQRPNLNFLKVFFNENFIILKIFERFQIDLNLLQTTLQEKMM